MASSDRLGDSPIHIVQLDIFGCQHLTDYYAAAAPHSAGCISRDDFDAARPYPPGGALHQLCYPVLVVDSRSNGGAAVHRPRLMCVLRLSRRRTPDFRARTYGVAL